MYALLVGEYQIIRIGTPLVNFLGGEAIAGGKMKETGTTHWAVSDSNVDNSSGFTGLGNGFRGNPSGYKNLGQSGSYWSSTPFGIIGNYPRGYTYRLVAQNNSFVYSVAVANNGNACRCIKDETTSIDNSFYKNEIQIYPNPATNGVFILFEEIRNQKLSIYDMMGNIVYLKNFTDNTNYIDIEFLPKGMYLIQVLAENYKVSHILIKQ